MLDDVITDKISEGGEGSYGAGGQYPSLQVTRTTVSLVNGMGTRSAPAYFTIDASVRPTSGAQLHDEAEGRYTTEQRKLYTPTAELWPTEPAHDADVVTLYPVAAEVDLASFCTNVDAELGSVIVGADGNGVTLQLIADGSGAGTYDETAWPAIKFHYEPSVTTVDNLVAAVTASAKLYAITSGTSGALFVVGDAQTVQFTGGSGEPWRVVACSRYRGFWKAIVERVNKP